MATTMRGGSVGKEKRITSPSSSTIRRSLKPLSSTKPSSSSPSATKNSSTSESKSISRPTTSSKNDLSKAPKKSILDKPASKPALDRRRSFDRPPPSSQVQRILHNGPTTRDVKTLRSSSFSNKTTTAPLASSSSHRPVTSTSVASRKVSVKRDPPVSKPGGLRRSTLTNNTVKDSTKSQSSTKKDVKRITQETGSVDYETCSDSHLMNEDHVLVNFDSEVESLTEISDMNETDNELADPTNIELEVKQLVEQDHTDIDTEDEHHQEDDKSVVDDQISGEPAIQESIPHDQEDQIAGKHSDEDIQEIVEETTDDQKREESNVLEPTESLIEDKKEEESIKEEAEVNKEEQTGETAPVRSEAAWKKENQAYNDVIEETAMKLRLKKNKVLALAGAFETVISLQGTNKN